MKVPLISVVVLTYNQFEQTTRPCLDSLRPWYGDPYIEFIVYDNDSPDGSREKTKKWCERFPAIKFVEGTTNLGYAGGMNAAAKFASGEWLYLVNNDTEFPAAALDALKHVLHTAEPEIGMIGPVTNSAGNGQRLYDPSKTKQQWLDLGAWLHQNPTNVLIPTYRCDFFCIAIRRSVWVQLNGLDTAFGPGYYEDFDFSLRLRQAGHEQSITEDVFIYHQGSATFCQSNRLKQLIRRNKKTLVQRHPKAKFLHARVCNLIVLKNPPYSNETTENGPIRIRKQIRVDALKKDTPKSLLKRLFWTLTTNKITRDHTEKNPGDS